MNVPGERMSESSFPPLPLYYPRSFLFRFTEDRRVARFHLQDVAPGTRVSVFRLEADPQQWRELLATAVAGAGGWVDLLEPLIVRAGQGFVVVPEA